MTLWDGEFIHNDARYWILDAGLEDCGIKITKSSISKFLNPSILIPYNIYNNFFKVKSKDVKGFSQWS